MKRIICLLSLLVLLIHSSCKNENRPKANEISVQIQTDTLEIKKKAKSSIKQDSTLKAKKEDLLITYSNNKIDTLLGFCNCEKNIKNNSLKIQIRTEFPSLSELEKGNRNATEFEMGVPRQYRFLTFYLRDSIVEKAELFMTSTEPQFNGKKIDSFLIHRYNIRITKFDYKIAQNIWGNYEVELQNAFGYTKNDTKLKGTFHCNNWKIVEYEELPGLTVKGENYIE